MESILKTIVARIEAEDGDLFKSFDPLTFKLEPRAAPIDVLASVARGFLVVAEVKRGSPSRGIIRENADPAALARAYERGGASAISVVTERHFFFGDRDNLRRVKRAVGLPVLRKDFITHKYQIYESYNLGADFVLLIAACLSEDRLRSLCRTAEALGMRTLVEVRTRQELKRALRADPRLIGINNRNLRTFKTDWTASLRLRSFVPPGIPVISESGINSRAQIQTLKAEGFSGVLIGEYLLKQPDPGRALAELLDGQSQDLRFDERT
jgi:indole-3-glycerol phosphate synthase